MYDLSETEPHRGSDLIPDGTFAKIIMKLRPGGVDGAVPMDKGLLKASGAAGSDVQSLDTEFTVVEGPFARRKFWQAFTVSGGKLDEKGASIGWNISKSYFRSMIDSALGLDPQDQSEAANAKRRLNGLAELDGITFIGKIAVEEGTGSYRDKNRLDRAVLPNEKEWSAITRGEVVPPAPSRSRAAKGSGAPAAPQPAWAPQGATAAAPASPTPSWQQPAPVRPAAPPAAAAAPTAGPVSAKPAGPAWLDG